MSAARVRHGRDRQQPHQQQQQQQQMPHQVRPMMMGQPGAYSINGLLHGQPDPGHLAMHNNGNYIDLSQLH